MAIDQSQVGQLAAQLMQELEDQYGEDAVLERAALIVAVAHDADQLTVHTRFAPDTPPWTQRGLLEYAARHVSP
jgi:nicotinamidase-related amidase